MAKLSSVSVRDWLTHSWLNKQLSSLTSSVKVGPKRRRSSGRREFFQRIFGLGSGTANTDDIEVTVHGKDPNSVYEDDDVVIYSGKSMRDLVGTINNNDPRSTCIDDTELSSDDDYSTELELPSEGCVFESDVKLEPVFVNNVETQFQMSEFDTDDVELDLSDEINDRAAIEMEIARRYSEDDEMDLTDVAIEYRTYCELYESLDNEESDSYLQDDDYSARDEVLKALDKMDDKDDRFAKWRKDEKSVEDVHAEEMEVVSRLVY